jgi:hypothetical protein
VPFPKSLLNAYHNKLKKQQNTQHPEKKTKSEHVIKFKDQKKETVVNGDAQMETIMDGDAKKETVVDDDAQKEAAVDGDNVQKEEENNHKEDSQTNSDARFEDADDQVMQVETYNYDDLWEDVPNSPTPTDLPHSQWENFKAPSRQRRGFPPRRNRY